MNGSALIHAGRRAAHGAVAHAGLLLVLGVALAERLAFLRWWKAFPGGDTYNFILIAQELLRGSYPIAEKRLPVYPLLLLLFRPLLDWEAAAIAVAVVSSLAALALLYAIGRTLGLSKTALAVGLLPFQAVAPFLFQSIRGYADTTFVALMLGAILAFLRTRTARGAAVSGLLASLAALTRPEGLLLVPAFVGLRLIRPPRRLALPLASAALIPLVLFALLSRKAERPLLPQEYLKDAEVTAFGVTDARTFSRNYGALWASTGLDRLWGEPLRLVRDAVSTPLIRVPGRLWSFLTDPKEIPSLLLLAGTIFLLTRGRWRPFYAVLLPFLAIALPIAWWGVRQRFLVVLYPLPYLLVAAGTHSLLRYLRKFQVRRFHTVRRIEGPIPRQDPLALATSLVLLALALGPWRFHTAAEAREVVAKNWGKDYAYYLAIQGARRLPGVIAFEHRSSIALALFGEPDRGRAVFADTHLNTPHAAEQWAALQQWQVRYLVIRGEQSAAFPVLSAPSFSDRFIIHRTFEHSRARGQPDRGVIYAIHP